MRKVLCVIFVSALALAAVYCSKSTEPVPPEPQPVPLDLSSADKALAQNTNSFGFELFGEINEYEDDSKNIFISPLSVSFALGMTENGAAGDTRDAMKNVLAQSGMADEEINQSYQNLITQLGAHDPTVDFSIANSIWYRHNKAIVQQFIDICTSYFDATVRSMDWADPTAADEVNGWVHDNTNGKISQIIRPPISQDVAMLLINAIYFKGAWTHQFDPEDTYDGMFFVDDATSVDCRMMSIEDTVSYLQNDLFQAVNLPYGHESFSMTVLLPQYSKTVDDVIAQLTDENWNNWIGSFSNDEMPLHMPRFKFAYELEMKDVLVAMGMGNAFDPLYADFSGMFVDGVGWISKVKHKSFVQVDEEGTEAAAVTMVVMMDSAPSGMYVNRPFVFVIHEKESGSILFMGKVVNPVWED